MIGSLDLATLQKLWWIITSLVGSLFVFMTFVQGGQTLVPALARNEDEKTLLFNVIGRKWELTFTTLVLFGGALFAAFPLFYATSFGGAYWVWMAILFTFVVQAVSYEYRSKAGNLLGARTFEFFLFLNGSVGILLIGAAVGTFYSGSAFELTEYNRVIWQGPLRGLEAALNPFNVCFGLFLVFLARCLGGLYLANAVNHPELQRDAGRAAFRNLLYSLPFLLFVVISLLIMKGYAVNPADGQVSLVGGKYLQNLLALHVFGIGFLLVGLVLVVLGALAGRAGKRSGIWLAGPGTVLVGLALFFTAGFNHTAFYPSSYDLQSSLTIANASSSHYTLTAMAYIALAVPFVLAYIVYVWRAMDGRKLSLEEVQADDGHELY